MKVHLGCGDKKMPGWVNCDIDPQVHPDKMFDLNGKWPFKDSSVDEIYSEFVGEHVRDLNNFISESYRILKRGGKLRLVTVNAGFWRTRLSFLAGKFTSTSTFSVWHCWLFKPTVLAEMFRAKDFDTKIEGHGLLPYPDVFYSKFELIGRKRQ